MTSMARDRTQRHPRSVPVPTGWAALVIVSISIPLAVLRPDDWVIVPIALGAVVLLMIGDFLAAPSPSGMRDRPVEKRAVSSRYRAMVPTVKSTAMRVAMGRTVSMVQALL